MAPYFGLFLFLSMFPGIFLSDERDVSKPDFTSAENYQKTYEYALGDDLTLLCSISNLGDYDVTWRKGEDEITPNDRFEFKFHEDECECEEEETTTSMNLFIKNLQEEDAGNYTCRVETDPPQTITHIVKIFNPEIFSTNQTFKAKVGDTVVLPCEIKNIGSYRVVWMKKKSVDYQYPDIDRKGGTLFYSDNGKKIKMYSATINFDTNKNDNPYRTVQILDSRLRLEYDDEDLDDEDDNIELIDGHNIKISNLNTDNSGTYFCFLRNDEKKNIGLVSHELEVERTIIQIPPEGEPTILVFDQKHKLEEKEYIRLPCPIANLGNYSVTWKKGGEVIKFNDRLFLHEYQDIKKEKYDLNVGPISLEDAGKYTCEINTEPPETITHTLVVVNPQILTTNQTFKVAAGESVELPCDTEDLGHNSFVVWKKNGKIANIFAPTPVLSSEILMEGVKPSGGFSRNLKLENVTFKDAGLYTCSLTKPDVNFPPRAIIGHKLEVVDEKVLNCV